MQAKANGLQRPAPSPPPVFWPHSGLATAQAKSRSGVLQRASTAAAPKPIAEYSRPEIIDSLRGIASLGGRIHQAQIWVLAQHDISRDDREGAMADLLRAADRAPAPFRVGPAMAPAPPAAPPAAVAAAAAAAVAPVAAAAAPAAAPRSALDELMHQQQRRESWWKFCLECSIPPEPYDRVQHYGNTPTPADRLHFGAQAGQVVDHDPPLVVRYYEGDRARGEKPGYSMTQPERLQSAADRIRMRLHSAEESRQQGDEMARYSNARKAENYPHWAQFYGPGHPGIQPSPF